MAKNSKRAKKKDESGDWWEVLDVGTGCVDEPVLILLAAVLAILLAWFFVLPLLVFVLDVLLVLLIAGGAIVMRLLLRRPWIVEAEERGRVSERREWLVVGRPAAARTIREVAKALETGWPLDRISAAEAVSTN